MREADGKNRARASRHALVQEPSRGLEDEQISLVGEGMVPQKSFSTPGNHERFLVTWSAEQEMGSTGSALGGLYGARAHRQAWEGPGFHEESNWDKQEELKDSGS